MAQVIAVYIMIPDGVPQAEATDGLNEMLRSMPDVVQDWAFTGVGGPEPLDLPEQDEWEEGAFTDHIADYVPLADAP